VLHLLSCSSVLTSSLGATLHYLLFAGHPWIRNYNDVKVPLDIMIFRHMKAYMRSSSLRKAALRVCIHLWWQNSQRKPINYTHW
jgi:hypothetical protein